jgi:hypothetical protein
VPINANVTNNQITASVSETQIDATVSGGFGPSGAAGAAATITVGTVTTGAPGTSASVVNAGTSSAAVLNFTIPAGAAGATGPQGATGPAGTTSWAGITDKPSTFPPSTHAHVAADISDFTSAVVAAAPPTTDASLLVQGTLPDARLSANIARTSDVSAAVAAVIDAAPASLDTLNELAAALGDDANFASTVTNALAGKAATSHTHGNITADGKIGTASNRLVTTGSGGVLVASFRPDLDVDSLTATLGVSAHSVSTTGSGVTVTGGSIIQRASGTFVTQFNVSNAGIVTVGQWQATAIAVAYGGTGATTAAGARTNLGLVIGTDVAAVSHEHSALAITSGIIAVARLPVVLEQPATIGNSGTSTTLGLTTGSVQTVTLNGNCTFTMPTATAGASITLILTQSGTFTASFTGVLWSGGTAPTITATANKRDILVFVSDGTNWYGTASQNH